MTDDALDQMATLAGALPFLKRYDDQTVVVKYGGHAMGEEETALRFGRDAQPFGDDGFVGLVRRQSRGRPWRRAADQRDAEAPRREVHLRPGAARHR